MQKKKKPRAIFNPHYIKIIYEDYLLQNTTSPSEEEKKNYKTKFKKKCSEFFISFTPPPPSHTLTTLEIWNSALRTFYNCCWYQLHVFPHINTLPKSEHVLLFVQRRQGQKLVPINARPNPHRN